METLLAIEVISSSPLTASSVRVCIVNSVRPGFGFYLPEALFCFYKPHDCKINAVLPSYLNGTN